MKLIFKFKRLISIAVLIVMMSTMLIIPASANGMGGVTFRDSNNHIYAWGDIWSYGSNYCSLAGNLSSENPSNLTLWIYAYVRDMKTYECFEIPTCVTKDNATSVTAYCPIDDVRYFPSQASADFIVNYDCQSYSYSGGWNP